jgi:hypothetical protein
MLQDSAVIKPIGSGGSADIIISKIYSILQCAFFRRPTQTLCGQTAGPNNQVVKHEVFIAKVAPLPVSYQPPGV